MVVQEELKEAARAASVASKILELMEAPISVGDRRRRVGASIGISIFPDDAWEAGGLLRCADGAMDRVKETGRRNVRLYSDRAPAA